MITVCALSVTTTRRVGFAAIWGGRERQRKGLTMNRCNQTMLVCVAAVVACAAGAQEQALPKALPQTLPAARPDGAAAGATRPQRDPEAGAPRGGKADRALRLLRIIDDPENKQVLNLTDAQKTGLKKRIRALNERQAVVDEALRIAAQEQMEQAAKVMTDKQAPTNAWMELVVKIGSLRTEQAKIQTEKLLAIRDTLSTDQILRANEALQKRTEEIRERLVPEARGARLGGKSKGVATPPQRPEGWDE
jgi:hypothetical protein